MDILVHRRVVDILAHRRGKEIRGITLLPHPPMDVALRRLAGLRAKSTSTVLLLIVRGTEEERSRSTTIYVGNLPYSFFERDVADLFERYGRLRKVTIPMDRYTGRNRGFAFIEYEDRRDAEDAFHKYHDYPIEGRRLRCDWDVGMEKKLPALADEGRRRERSRSRSRSRS